MMCYVVRNDLAKDVVSSFNPAYKIGRCKWILYNSVTTFSMPGFI